MTPPIVVEVKNSKMNIARNSLKDGVAKVSVELKAIYGLKIIYSLFSVLSI